MSAGEIYSSSQYHSSYGKKLVTQLQGANQHLTKSQAYHKAGEHLKHALLGLTPQPQVTRLTEGWMQYFRALRNKSIVSGALLLAAYFYLYFILAPHLSQLELSLLVIFALEALLDGMVVVFDQFQRARRAIWEIPFKTSCICLLAYEQMQGDGEIGWVSIARAGLLISYDPDLRKAVISVLAAWKDILIFLICYLCVVFGFAVLGTEVISIPKGAKQDPIRQNYRNPLLTFVNLYVAGTYDSYPDSQLPAYRANPFNLLYFFLYIFINMFVFGSVPASRIFYRYRDRRRQLLLAEEHLQHQSLFLAYVTLLLGQTELSRATFEEWLLSLYGEDSAGVIVKLSQELSEGSQIIALRSFLQILRLLKNVYSLQFPQHQLLVWTRALERLTKWLQLASFVGQSSFSSICLALVLLSFPNTCLLYAGVSVCSLFDLAFFYLFVVEVTLKMVAMGMTGFLNNRLNRLDLFLLVSSMFLMATFERGQQISSLLRSLRLLRFIALMEAWRPMERLRRLADAFLVITPLLMRSLSLFVLFYYIVGVAGMQLFKNHINLPPTIYANYAQISGFHSFLATQHLMMQILTEAGWSYVAYDHSLREEELFVPVMSYFILCHFCIVLVLAALLKTVLFQAYFIVYSESAPQLAIPVRSAIYIQGVPSKREIQAYRSYLKTVIKEGTPDMPPHYLTDLQKIFAHRVPQSGPCKMGADQVLRIIYLGETNQKEVQRMQAKELAKMSKESQTLMGIEMREFLAERAMLLQGLRGLLRYQMPVSLRQNLWIIQEQLGRKVLGRMSLFRLLFRRGGNWHAVTPSAHKWELQSLVANQIWLDDSLQTACYEGIPPTKNELISSALDKLWSNFTMLSQGFTSGVSDWTHSRHDIYSATIKDIMCVALVERGAILLHEEDETTSLAGQQRHAELEESVPPFYVHDFFREIKEIISFWGDSLHARLLQ